MLQELLSSDLTQTASTLVTSISTIVLAVLTWVLARATNAMARATSEPQVVASLEPNLWSLTHLDLIVENTGNAPAHDVQIVFDPPLPSREANDDLPTPFQDVSIVRPGQILVSYACAFEAAKGKKFKVGTSWKRRPTDRNRETLEYTFDMRSLDGVSVLGRRSPEVQIAEEIKKIRNDWLAVARGTRRLKSEVYSQNDRDKETREARERLEANRANDS